MLRLQLVAWLLPLALVAPAIASAAPADKSRPQPSAFHVRRWTADEGLPQGRVACITQTRDGYLWVGTWSGLARFNGIAFTIFNKLNTPALHSDAINALVEDTQGTLWIGTHEGLVSYRDRHFTRVSLGPGLSAQDIPRMAASRNGGIWLRAGDRTVRLLNGAVAPGWPARISGRNVRALFETPDGCLQMITDDFWLSLSAGDSLTTNYCATPGSPLLTATLGGSPNTGWLGTSHGVRWLGPPASNQLGPAPLTGSAVPVLCREPGGNLWAGAEDGMLFYISPARTDSVELGLGSPVCIDRDREGDVWLGCQMGLARVHRGAVQTFTTAEGLADNNAVSVCQGTDGSVWVGTIRGVSCIRDGKVVPLPAQEPSPDYTDRSVWPGTHGALWISKPGIGLVLFHKGRFESAVPANLFPGDPSVLYADAAGQLLVGTRQGLLTVGPGPRPQSWILSTNLASYDVRCLQQTRDGALWFGTMKQGLGCLRGQSLTLFTQRDGLSDNSVWSLLEDSEGTLWLGTDNGLTCYSHGRFFAFRQIHGLPERTVNCVLQDNAGNLWLSGLHGIHRAHTAELKAVAAGRAPAAQFLTVGTADGMVNAEANGGENQPAGWKAQDGHLWFPTVAGVVVLDPAALPDIEPVPPAIIEQVRADDVILLGDELSEPSDATDRQSLGQDRPSAPHARPAPSSRPGPDTSYSLTPGKGRLLEFTFAANSFVAPERVRFRYRLLGVDPNWGPETGEHTARYVNLPPGRYEFQIMAANHHHVWNDAPAVFTVTLEPFFWQTWPFYLACAGLVICLGAALQAYRLKWQHRLLKLEEQRALASERARIARDLHDDLGTALTGLALEMDVAGRNSQSGASVDQRASAAAQRLRDLAERMREVVWTVNPRCDTVPSLANFLEQQVSQFLNADSLRVRLDFPEQIPDLPLPAAARHALALSMREALTNVVRHSQATEVSISLSLHPSELSVQIQDNGVGFQSARIPGQGLTNMRERLEQVGGRFECKSAPGQGAIIRLALPLNPNSP